MTVIIVRPSDLRTRAIPHAPDTFDGLRSGYIAQWLDPVLPDVSEVERLHHLLAGHVQNESATLLVRHVTGMERGTVYRTWEGALLKATDNAPAWWWHSVLFNRVRVDADNLSSFIEATPWHFHQTGKWTTINHSGWHAAHIFDVKDGDTDWPAWSRGAAVRRFIRNIHPCNIFFVPKTEWQRVGADPALIAAVAGHYRRRYSSVWMEFLRLAQVESQGGGEVDGPLVIGAAMSAAVPLATPKVLIPLRRAAFEHDGTPRTWTMNSNIDYYVKTGETARFLDLSLRYLHPDGRIEPVGRYALDLDSLVERGAVTRRQSVYDIKLVRAGGRFWIGGRQVGKLLLEEFSKQPA